MGILDLLAIGLALSVILNIGLIYHIYKIIPKRAPLTYDAQAVLRDLVSGPVLIKVEYVDPSDFLLRSPRHR